MAFSYDDFTKEHGSGADDKVAEVQERIDNIEAEIDENSESGMAKTLEANLTVTRVEIPLFTDNFEAEDFKSVPEIARNFIFEALRYRYVLSGWDDLAVQGSEWHHVILTRYTPPPE